MLQRSRSSEAGAGSPATIRQRSGAVCSSQCSRSGSGSRGSPSLRTSARRAERRPSRSSASHTTRSGARIGFSPAASAASSFGSGPRRRRRREEGILKISTSALSAPSGRLRCTQARSSRSSRPVAASRRNRILSPPRVGQQGSSIRGVWIAEAMNRGLYPSARHLVAGFIAVGAMRRPRGSSSTHCVAQRVRVRLCPDEMGGTLSASASHSPSGGSPPPGWPWRGPPPAGCSRPP